MRTKNEYKRIAIKKELYEKIIKDRNNFQQTIGRGKWSINDTINEYIKIIEGDKE